MQWRSAATPWTAIIAGLVGMAGIVATWWLYTPWLASVRREVFWVGLVATTLACAMAWKRQSDGRWGVGTLLALMAAFGLLFVEVRFQTRRLSMISTMAEDSGADYSDIGRHIIVGYKNVDELKRLISVGAVGGVFITARNVRGRSRESIAAEIASIQAEASRYPVGRLIVATDQEGGFVSRLSPPLARPQLLADVIRRVADPAEREANAYNTGMVAGRDLASIGVTLNFAPVADIDFGIRNPTDKFSRIGERAISTDANVVAAVARAYCRGMAEAGVMCTLKHFPGLGRITIDTHVASASLAIPLAELEAKDWLPFAKEKQASGAAVMVGHLALDAVERGIPAALSRAVTTGLLRQKLGHDGLIVTDDLCMSAVSDLPGGVGSGAIKALAAGADLVLISYDPDQIYGVLARVRDHLPDRTSAARVTAFADRR